MERLSGQEAVKREASERFVYRNFDIIVTENAVQFSSGLVLESVSLARHLLGCTRCAVLAVTLGIGVDRTIARLQHTSLAEAMAVDAAANAAVEALCDAVTAQIAHEAVQEGLSITPRYSPGYGDFSLCYQPILTTLLDTQRRLGLTVTQDNLLLPQKSVTALVGYTDRPMPLQNRCTHCLAKSKCEGGH